MRVSIVIPTFNRADFLVDAITSALAQDYKDIEVIVSDNASKDHTEAVGKYFSRDPRVKYFRNSENIGLVKNWHRGAIECATGEWFLILSDDDVLTNPHFISQAVKLIESSKNLVIVYANSYIYDEALNTITKLTLPFRTVENGIHVFSKRGSVRPQDFALCNVLFNRKLAAVSGAFGNVNNLSCDTELFLHLCLKGDVGFIHEYSSIYRVHSATVTSLASKTTSLAVGSLDSLLRPLLEAENAHIDKGAINNFILNSKVRTEILVSLLKTAAISKEAARALYSDISNLLKGYEFKLLPSWIFFNLILFAGNTFAPLFLLRRRALFFLNTLKRSFFGRKVYFELLKQKVYLID